MSKRYLLYLLFLLLGKPLSAQEVEFPGTEDQYEKEYQERITKEYLFYPPVYIPKDLTDAFIQLNKLIDPPSKQKFKNMQEEDVRRKLYFSFGKWITQNWGFYGGSRLSHYIKGLGVHHPEDMAVFVMVTYHRNLNKQPLNVKELINEIQDKREQEWNAQRLRGTVIHEEKRQRPRDSTVVEQNDN